MVLRDACAANAIDRVLRRDSSAMRNKPTAECRSEIMAMVAVFGINGLY
jgi:hypothetical protein